MRFLTLLKAGATPQYVAKKFAEALAERCEAALELDLELVAVFLSEALKAIGISAHLTAGDLAELENYAWPRDVHIFTFAYNAVQFAPFERFLVELCACVHDSQEAYLTKYALRCREMDDQHTSVDDHELLLYSPVEWLMELLAIWHKTCRIIQSHVCHKYFMEPFARISYFIFLGFHKLRKLYRQHFELLGNMCERFYQYAAQGLFYQRSHDLVVNGILDLLEVDLDIFCEFAPASLEFIYQAFSVKDKKATYTLLYKRLKLILLHYPKATNVLALTSFLISPTMQNVYYTTLQRDRTQTVLIAVLEFLKVLQSKLTSIDQISQDFIEAILLNVSHDTACVRDMSADVYITLSRRKMMDQLVFNHFMDFYMQQMSSLDMLPQFVHALWPHFSYMRSIDVYLKVIANASFKEEVRLLNAHVLVIVYKYMLLQSATYSDPIEQILNQLPEIMINLTSLPLRGILLQIFQHTKFEVLENIEGHNPQLIINAVEDCTLKLFETSKALEFPLLLNAFTQCNRCLIHTQHWDRLEFCCVRIFQDYQRIERALQIFDQEDELPNATILSDYRDVLQKLSILLKTDYELFDSLDSLFNSLKARVVDTKKIYEYVMATNSFSDIYAIDVLASCLIKVATADTLAYGMEFRENFEMNTKEISSFILAYLGNIQELASISLARTQAYYNCLVKLYCTFNATSSICTLRLDVRSYHILVQSLVLLLFQSKEFNLEDGDEPTIKLPERIIEYQKLMFHHFLLLHAKDGILIPNSSTWKLCIYYGQSTSQRLNAELKELLFILASNRFDQYRNIVAVLIFNLYKQRPALKEQTVLNAMKAHTLFMENELRTVVESTALLKVHIVLTTLQIIEKSMSLTEERAGANRLQALKHLPVLIRNLNLIDSCILNDIDSEIGNLRKYHLNSLEEKFLQNFATFFKKYEHSTSNNISQENTITSN